ncbi:MAG: GIY-YIG nuclease family protein [Candidatus Paceibacterota bacterium]
MHILHLLKSINFSKSYIGITNNPERRLKEHNSGKSFYTKKYSPWKIIYTEECKNFKEAREREKFYKSSVGRRALKKIFDKLG